MNLFKCYPFNRPELVEKLDGDCCVTRNRARGHLCGYVAIHKDGIPKEWRGDYDADGLQYLGVHGGITFCECDDGEHVVFGLDCMHPGDEDDPNMQDPEHVMELVRDMKKALYAYAERIEEWRAANREGRIAILDEINAPLKHECGMGLRAMMFMMLGAKELGE